MAEAAQTRERGPMVGIITLTIKLGGKFAKFGVKAMKMLKGGKAVMGVASFASWAVLLSWQFAVIIIAQLVIHEWGHIRAMKSCGMATKGIYLIPFFGGAAVAEGDFPDRRSEVYIALMGPVYGGLCAVGVFALYGFTGAPVLAAAASWMALINLFNLMPINPLDGGRVFKSLAMSAASWGVWPALTLNILAAGVAVSIGSGLLIFLTVIGVLELLFDYKHRDDKPAMGPMEMAGAMAYTALLTLALVNLMLFAGDAPGADLALDALVTN